MQWYQVMLTVKVLSPDKTVMGKADGINGPASYSPLCDRGECEGPPRGLRPRRASHRDYVVTREIRQSAQKEAHPWTSIRSEEEGNFGVRLAILLFRKLLSIITS